MNERRRVLAALAGGAAAIPVAALAEKHTSHPAGSELAQKTATCKCCLPPGANSDYFPNVSVYTHDGRKVLFYNDLLQGRLVLINFMSIKNDLKYPVTANLAKVQRLLGERVGRDVFMYSITTDPERDTPYLLGEFAKSKGAKPGWLFLTGRPADMEAIKGRFFVHRGGHQGHETHDCSMGLVRYGNEPASLWGSVAAKADPAQIAERVTWITPKPLPSGPPKRRGPATILRVPAPLAKKS